MKHVAAAVIVISCAVRVDAAPQAVAKPPQRPRPVSAPARPVLVVKAEPAPLPRSVRWVQRSAEYRALFLQVYRMATTHVERAAETRAAGTWAIVTDADETVLANSIFESELMAKGGEEAKFDEALWKKWVQRVEAPPLPGAAEFLHRVHRLGGRIAIVTNRSPEFCAVTEQDLKKYGVEYDVVLCGSGDKNARFESVRSGAAFGLAAPVEVVAYLGDNINDFPLASQAWRKLDDNAFAEFGGRFFAFPNPMYGSFPNNPD